MKKQIARITIASIMTLALIITAVPIIGFIGQPAAGAATGALNGVSLTERIASSFTADAATKKVTVNFDANGGEVAKESAQYKIGSKFMNLPKATRKNYSFKGWYTKKKGGKKIANGKKVTFKKTTTLYAHWSAVKVNAAIPGLIGKTFAAIKKKEGELTYVKSAGKKFGKIAAVEYNAPLYMGQAYYYEFNSKGKSAKDKDKCIAVHTTLGALFPKVKDDISCAKLAKHIGGTYMGYETSSSGKKGAQYYQFFRYKKYGIVVDYYSSHKKKDTIPTEGAMCVIYKR